jgi:aspartate carbamoyltransferase catalytic subunit
MASKAFRVENPLITLMDKIDGLIYSFKNPLISNKSKIFIGSLSHSRTIDSNFHSISKSEEIVSLFEIVVFEFSI